MVLAGAHPAAADMAAWPAWMLLLLLLLCVSERGLARCSVQPIAPPKLSKVSCPPIKAQSQMFSFLLLLNDSYVTKIHLSKSDSAGSLVSGHFEVTSSGAYVCRSEGIYPPPFTEDCRSTAVTEGGPEATEEGTQPLPATSGTVASARLHCPPPGLVPEVAMWAACALLLLYSVSVSCIAAVLWRKRRVEDCAVYMNTRRADPKRPAKP
ncbi:uncharacterized protein LOC114847241 isoform X2 [Betta splendens]|uniref:Uncharacterized protein LOC114847241 isoform X2 n=1 Tax=Betta splendens TaxID=158456 RepID=A0A6P7LEG6_BETSP|nr:uncharacterized protein LOC114847241 isoform X2 [Betta splendens]